LNDLYLISRRPLYPEEYIHYWIISPRVQTNWYFSR